VSQPSEATRSAHRSAFCVGGISVEITGDSAADITFVPSLQAFRVSDTASDIVVRVEWVTKLHAMCKRPVFDSGSVWSLYEKNDGFQFDFKAPVFAAGNSPYKRLLVDSSFRHATLQMSESSFADFPHAAEPLEYPLDELLIMHRLTQEKAIELHSCGIVTQDGTGNLFVGHSGAGKSTTTRLWMASQDVEILSDDRIILRRDAGVAAEIPREDASGAREQQVLRLRSDFASRTRPFAQDDRAGKCNFAQDDTRQKNPTGIRMYGTPWHGEAAFASPASAPLKRICILEHGRGNVLTRLSPGQAVAELFARSFVPFHRHEYVDAALKFLEEVAEAVPCYHFAFEPDQGAVEAILNSRN
jgi:hypothetical protein